MRWPSFLLYAALLVYGIAFSFAPTLFSGFRLLQTDPGDTILNHYFLEHSWRWVSQADYRGELWSPAFFYPERNVLGYSDNLFGAAPVYWLVRCVAAELPAYQIWMILGFALNFLAMAIALRWLGIDHWLCALGAFLFAFGTPHVQQIGHQQLTYRCWTPFAIYYGWRFFQGPSGGRLFRCLFCITWQFYAVVYVGWFLAFGIGCVVIILLATDRESRWRLYRFVRERPFAASVPIVINGLLLAILVVPYLRANEGYRREFSEALAGSPHWNSWLSAPPGTLWSPLVKSITLDMGGEGFLFGGLTFLILGAACVVVIVRSYGTAEDRLLIRAFALASVALGALTLVVVFGPDRGGSLWYGVYQIVPGARAIRCIARVYLIVYPLLGIAGLVAIQRLYESSEISRKRFFASLVVLAAAENYFPQMEDLGRSFDPHPFHARARQVACELRGVDAAYGLWRLPCADYEHELMMMWAGLDANVPVINGYSGRQPKNYPFNTDFSLASLKDWLGPSWRGRLAIVSNGEPVSREVWWADAAGNWERLE